MSIEKRGEHVDPRAVHYNYKYVNIKKRMLIILRSIINDVWSVHTNSQLARRHKTQSL